MEAEIGDLIPLNPIRVLLASRDRRFLRVAGFLLSRNGFLVETVPKPSALPKLLERHGADVVVLDSGDSLGAAARTVAQIETLHPQVTVLVVADTDCPCPKRLRILPKWNSFDQLVEEVEHACMHCRRSESMAPSAP